MGEDNRNQIKNYSKHLQMFINIYTERTPGVQGPINEPTPGWFHTYARIRTRTHTHTRACIYTHVHTRMCCL